MKINVRYLGLVTIGSTACIAIIGPGRTGATLVEHPPPPSANLQVALSAPIQRANGAVALTERDPIVPAVSDPFTDPASVPALVASPPPPPVPLVIATPEPPPVPFRYFGSMIDVAGTEITYLSRDGLVFPIQVAQTLDDLYRVEAIDGGEIVLMHLPSQTRVSIKKVSAAS